MHGPRVAIALRRESRMSPLERTVLRSLLGLGLGLRLERTVLRSLLGLGLGLGLRLERTVLRRLSLGLGLRLGLGLGRVNRVEKPPIRVRVRVRENSVEKPPDVDARSKVVVKFPCLT